MTDENFLTKLLPEKPHPEKFLQAIEAAFVHQGSDSAYIDGMRMAVPGAKRLYGVKVPLLRKLSKQVIKKYGKKAEAIQSIAQECWLEGSREHELVALFLLDGISLIPSERWELGMRFLPDVSNWETCDQLCMALLGQALAKDPKYMDVLETWIEDENFWIRRAALVAPVYLRRAKYPPEVGKDLDRRTLRMASKLLNDEEKYIRKAVDWTIREVVKRRYELGFEWLKAHAESNLSRIGRSTLRLASKKLLEDDQGEFLMLLDEEHSRP